MAIKVELNDADQELLDQVNGQLEEQAKQDEQLAEILSWENLEIDDWV